MDQPEKNSGQLEASFSTLILSLASQAMTHLGIAPDLESGQIAKNPEMAKFNIDLLIMLKKKTENNLSQDEKTFLDNIIQDLQLKFVQK